MRLERFDLTRYGHFTDVSLHFPRQTNDLHLIYGPNEAGKSTTRKALIELLFGFEKSTPFNFQHDYDQLRLGACLEAGDEMVEVIRRKTNRNSLIDLAEQPVDEDRWQQLLGHVDRESFKRMFALDHSLLVQGSREMLDSQSDIGRVLFQAAAGLSHFNQVRAELVTEAGQWWAARARKDVRYFEARARRDVAQAQLKDHSLSEAALRTLQREVDEALEKADTARDQRFAARTRIAVLERIRRVAPRLSQLAQLEEQLGADSSARALPQDARETLRSVTYAVATADSALREIAATLDEQQARRDALRVDTSLLAYGTQIDALAEALGTIESQRIDLPKRKIEREQLRRELGLSLSDLGLPEMTPDAIAARLPTLAHRERLRTLADDLATQQASRATAQAGQVSARRAVDTLRAELARLPAEPEHDWNRLIDGAKSVFEGANARQLAQAAADTEAALRELQLTFTWSGSLDSLQALQPPSDAETVACVEALRVQRGVVADVRRSQRELAVESAERSAEISARQAEAVPDISELQSARSARDLSWEGLAAGHTTLADTGPTFYGLMKSADEIADQRYAGVDAATRMDELRVRLAAHAAKAQALAEQEKAATAAIEEQLIAWGGVLIERGMGTIAPEEASVWLEQRREVLAARARADRARAALATFTGLAEVEGSRLQLSLGRTRPPGMESSAWLQTLLSEAGRMQQEAIGQRARRVELERQLDDQIAVLAQSETDVASGDAVLAAWEGEWAAACSAAGFPTTTRARDVGRLLEAFEVLRQKSAKFTELEQARIQPMERNLADFEVKVQACVALAAPGYTAHPAADAVRLMARDVQVAREADRAVTDLDVSLELQRGKLRQQEIAKATAMANLVPLLQLAETDDPEALDQLITVCDERRSREDARSALILSILEHGEGLALEQLQREVLEVPADQLEAKLAECQQAHVDAEQAQQSAQTEAALAQARLNQREGDDVAVHARAAKGQALRDMADAVEAFIGMQTQSLLLDWALKRYREEKQAPHLQRASEYFEKLTQGVHVRLLAEEDGGAVNLASRRAGQGGRVTVDGMSEGTRDQLYLALRLAALDLHLDRGVALPFVADDLLINFDNDRTRAAFGCLARLSQRTQVLYFTHHRHMLDLAREAVGDDVHVLELG